MRVRTDFPRRVRVIEHVRVPLSDGTRLAARVWLPDDAERDPVPAVLEAIPYRLNDGTIHRDAPRAPYLAGHGYAVVRVDLRGSGESDGVLEDEYSAREQDDVVEAIAWTAEQAWCTGAVGMWGISWGGFNSLQAAARRPPALKAIMTLCSTDDRYADDVHYRGGCVLALDMLHWATYMLMANGRAPDPAIVGERWRDLWLERLEGSPPLVEHWLAHQRRDAYWKHGSVCEDYGAIEAAVYAVGGWADGYTNAVLRLLAGLPGPRKGLIGPWGHTFPDQGAPQPAIGFLQESLRWWDHWLKGRDTGIMDEPMLRVWLQDWVEPKPTHRERPGRWAGEESWPSPWIRPRRLVLNEGALEREARGEAPLEIVGSHWTGLDAGAWCEDGAATDSPPDQRADDGYSLSFTSAPLAEPVEILGFPEVELALAADRPNALVAVRLCDVAPGGASLVVSRGLLNLTHRESHEHAKPLEPGRRYAVSVRLDAVGHAFPAGHRIRVAVSPTYWPWAWPSPEPVRLTVFAGASRLELPERPPRAEDAELPAFEEPESAPGRDADVLAAPEITREVTRDYATRRAELAFRWYSNDHRRLPWNGLETRDENLARYSIVEDDPLSAEVRCQFAGEVGRDGWRTRVEAEGVMSADAERFLVTTSLDAYEGTTRIFARRWTLAFPRDHV